jgi:prophage DNA circulation protein
VFESHHFYLILERIEKQGERIMSAITDFAAKVNANFATLSTEIQALDDKITAFQNAASTLSAADQAALDGIAAASAALVTKAAAVVPVTPPAPAA